MLLTRALVATDLNPHYLEFWPLVRRAWPAIVGIDPLLVLVAPAGDVPAELRDDPQVHVFEPLPELHTAFQAQCIRLLYPALLPTEGAVITSDADMVPMSADYFLRPPSRVDGGDFLAYRDVLLDAGEVPICYNAARPATWAATFGVRSIEDVRARLEEWWSRVAYDGTHGGTGWGTDQEVLYRALVERGRRTRTVWILDDHYTRFRRLERAAVRKHRALSDRDRRLIARRVYTDFHCAAPHRDFRELNELVVDLASEAAAEGRAGTMSAAALLPPD